MLKGLSLVVTLLIIPLMVNKSFVQGQSKPMRRM